jgi:hypothetical protein
MLDKESEGGDRTFDSKCHLQKQMREEERGQTGRGGDES